MRIKLEKRDNEYILCNDQNVFASTNLEEYQGLHSMMKLCKKNCEGIFELAKFETYQKGHNPLALTKSLPVEVAMESIGRVKMGIGSSTEQRIPKLDENGCLILKPIK